MHEDCPARGRTAVDLVLPLHHLARDHAALGALEEARLPGERREPAIRARRVEPLAVHAHGALADRQAVERGQQPLERTHASLPIAAPSASTSAPAASATPTLKLHGR